MARFHHIFLEQMRQKGPLEAQISLNRKPRSVFGVHYRALFLALSDKKGLSEVIKKNGKILEEKEGRKTLIKSGLK